MLITPEYLELNKEKHRNSKDFGITGKSYVQFVMMLAHKHGTSDILDYGCGKSTLADSIPFKIQQYDPAILKYSQMPWPADIVACTDVMEHVEEECVDDVLDHIKSLTKKAAIFTISVREAEKHFSNGKNLHVTIKPYQWWVQKLWDRFDLSSLEHQKGRGFMAVVEP